MDIKLTYLNAEQASLFYNNETMAHIIVNEIP